MDKVSCLKRIANALAGSTVTNYQDDTICKVLHKIGDNVKQFISLSDVKFIINVTTTGDTSTADKTFAQIKAAHEAGKVVECHYQTLTLHPLLFDGSTFSFSGEVMSDSTTAQRTTINITANAVGVAVLSHTLTPVA